MVAAYKIWVCATFQDKIMKINSITLHFIPQSGKKYHISCWKCVCHLYLLPNSCLINSDQVLLICPWFDFKSMKDDWHLQSFSMCLHALQHFGCSGVATVSVFAIKHHHSLSVHICLNGCIWKDPELIYSVMLYLFLKWRFYFFQAVQIFHFLQYEVW